MFDILMSPVKIENSYRTLRDGILNGSFTYVISVSPYRREFVVGKNEPSELFYFVSDYSTYAEVFLFYLYLLSIYARLNTGNKNSRDMLKEAFISKIAQVRYIEGLING